MARASAKIGLILISTAAGAIGYTSYSDYKDRRAGYGLGDDFPSSASRPSSVHYHHGSSNYSSSFWGFGSSSGDHGSSGSSSSSSHTSRGGFGSGGHAAGS